MVQNNFIFNGRYFQILLLRDDYTLLTLNFDAKNPLILDRQINGLINLINDNSNNKNDNFKFLVEKLTCEEKIRLFKIYSYQKFRNNFLMVNFVNGKASNNDAE